MSNSERIVHAIARMWKSLPSIIDKDWNEFESELLILLRRLENEQEDEYDVLEEIFALFKPYSDVFEVLQSMVSSEEISWKSPTLKLVTERVHGKEYISYERYVGIPVFYATDRKGRRDKKIGWKYGGTRGQLSFGIVEVSIPDHHEMGELEKPRWWKLQFIQNPEKFIVVLRVDRIGKDEFITQSRKRLAELSDRDALVFIHGYNCSFEDAARRCAQITYDLNFKGLPLLYSWPSEGAPLKYLVDEGNIQKTRKHFDDFLMMTLTRLGIDTVHVIAHSMGNRVLADTLSRMRDSEFPEGSGRLRQVIFAAPDIDRETFIDLAEEFYMDVDRYTLYASTKDIPLEIAGLLHKYQRAGDSDPEVTIVKGIDTIDASNIKVNFIGHSYFGDSKTVIYDILNLITNDSEPGERGLAEYELSGKKYWAFK